MFFIINKFGKKIPKHSYWTFDKAVKGLERLEIGTYWIAPDNRPLMGWVAERGESFIFIRDLGELSPMLSINLLKEKE